MTGETLFIAGLLDRGPEVERGIPGTLIIDPGRIVTFGGEARLHTPLQPASAVKWSDMVADGGTPMGQAMTMAISAVMMVPVMAGRAP